MASDTAFIFDICVPFGNTFSLVPKAKVSVDIKVKTMTITGALMFTKTALKTSIS